MFVEKFTFFKKSSYKKVLQKILQKERKLSLSNSKLFLIIKKIDNIKFKTNKFVDDIQDKGGKVFGLGASTKGNILLQHFGLTKEKFFL